MQPSNLKLVATAALVITAVLTITWWSARQHDAATGTTASATDGSLPQAATTDANAVAKEPALRDIWAGRALPPRPTGGKDRSFLTGTPEQRERAKAEYARLAEDLERDHAQQPIDPEWKGPTEAALASASENEGLQRSGIAPESIRTDCRSSSCRVSADFGNTADAQDWATLYTAMTGKNFRRARFVTVPQPDGSVEVRIYGSRR